MPSKAMKIKVPVSVLIKAAEAQRQQIIAQHVDAVRKHSDALHAWEGACIEALSFALEEARAGRPPESGSNYRNGDYLIVKITDGASERPSKPSSQPPTAQVDRDLALLNATADDVLLISTDDKFAGYLS